MTEISKNSTTSDNSAFGTLGEKQVDAMLSSFIEESDQKKFLFDVRFMGEKAHLLDFLVRLIDEDAPSRAREEYFFAQIKTVHEDKSVYPVGSKNPTALSIEFTKKDVYQAQCMHAPVYVIAVDARKRAALKVYVTGISSSQKHGIYHCPTAFDLDNPKIMRALKDEVIEYFAGRPKVDFTSTFGRPKSPEGVDVT